MNRLSLASQAAAELVALVKAARSEVVHDTEALLILSLAKVDAEKVVRLLEATRQQLHKVQRLESVK